MTITTGEVKAIRDWLASYGADPAGGMTRLLYTEEWLKAQQALREKFRALGMVAEFDEVGNLYGKYIGTDGTGETIATGSHVDTVVSGGKLDGALGIFGGYLAVKHLIETYGPPKKNLEVISLAEEEGSRFPFVFWGSKNFFGLANEADIKDLHDANSISFPDAMRQCGFHARQDPESPVSDVTAFLELHIEQGNTLEMEGQSVGVVSSIAGQRRYNITLKGQANHAGTTLMRYRHDVVQVFAEIVSQSLQKANAKGDPLVLTFGKIVVKPNTVNVVPGEALFTMDCRHTDRGVLTAFTAEIEADMVRIAASHGVEIAIDRWMDEDPVPMNGQLVTLLEDICKGRGLNYRMMHSGAGHDAQIIAPRIPTGMIFVPSKGGVSHNPAEETSLEDLNQGIALLAAALHKLAY